MMMFKVSLVAMGVAAQVAWCRPEPPDGFLLVQERAVTSARAVTAARFPDADRVLVDDHVFERYEKDGTSVLWDDEYSKVLTEKGRRDASSHQLMFDLNYGTSFVYRAEIIKPDGRVVTVDTEAYSRVMTEPGQMGSNIYDPSNKILSFSLPGVEIGDVCHLVTCRVTSKSRMPGTWSDYAVMEYDQPIVKLDYDISAPPELPLRHKVLRAPVAHTLTYAESRQPDGRTLHAWRAVNVPQMFPEPDMPPLHTQVQRLILSTIEDWRTVSRWYWQLCQPALAKTTPAMQATVDKLVAGAATRDEKIRRVFKFVSQEIRYMGITTEDVAPGYEPHPVDLTFNNRYGVCRDKAVLLAAMLNLAGVPAYPVLIHAGAKMDPDVPIPFFNHAITAVDRPGGGYLLMDPTDENTRDLFPAYLCNRSYLVARPEGETLLVSDVYPAEMNLARIVTDGTLDATGSLLLKTRVTFEGINDNAYRGHLLRLKSEQRRKFFESVLKGRLPGAEVVECAIVPEDLQDTETPLSVALTARVPEYPVRGDGVDVVAMPWLGTVLGYANFVIGQTGLKARRYTMETGITCGIDERVALRVAAGLGAPHALPAAVHVERGGVRFDMNQTATNGVLSGAFRYALTTPEFSPAEYLELKAALEEIEAASRRRPLFEAACDTPDQETLRDETETLLLSPHAWTTTRSWSKRVLTYAGKKKGAELKFNFNPAWQSIDVVAAVVSNANGSVHAVTPKEMNVMDAAWVGEAPRYPAAKTLVVNLPGVETGSVITVTTRLTQTNGYFYSHCHTFGGAEPVRSETYRLTCPTALSPTLQTFHAETLRCSVVTNGSTVTMSWSASGLPAVRAEEQQPPWHFFKPTVFVSFGEWKAHARTLRQAVHAVSEDDAQARRRAKEIVKGVRDPRARILAIRNEVLRSIRIAGPSFIDLPPDSLSSPDRTLADQYGHPADRALLLAAMLDAAGVRAELLFAGQDTTRYPAFSQPLRRVPQLGFYVHPVVAVELDGETLYLNEGDQYDELGASAFDAGYSLTLKGRELPLSVAEPLRNSGRSAWSIDLDGQGTAKISVTNWFCGTQAGPFRKQYSEMLPEDRRRHHLELVGDISKAAEAASELVTDTAAYPCVRAFSVTAARYAVVENGVLTLMIPELAGAVFPLRADARETPLFLGQNDRSEWTCLITLPPGYTRLPVLPAPKRWTLPNGLGTLAIDVQTTTRVDGRVEVRVERRVERCSGEASPELYPALLEYNRRLTHPSARTLVAERDGLLK